MDRHASMRTSTTTSQADDRLPTLALKDCDHLKCYKPVSLNLIKLRSIHAARDISRAACIDLSLIRW